MLPDVDLDRLVRRCRSLGVEIEVEGSILRVRTATTPPPPLVGSRATPADGVRTASGTAAAVRRQSSKTSVPTRK